MSITEREKEIERDRARERKTERACNSTSKTVSFIFELTFPYKIMLLSTFFRQIIAAKAKIKVSLYIDY